MQHNLVDGASTCRTFTAGHKFTLTSHPDGDVVSEQGKSYLLTSVEHSASQPSDDTGDGSGASYDNRFTCLVDSVQFRPPRTTPCAGDLGVQTAVVVGPAGDEIYTDKYGQVKVQFHWDRQGKKRREQLLLDPRVADVGGQGMGIGVDAANRPRGDRRFPRRRSGPADHPRQRAQRGQRAAAHRCRQRAQVEHAQGLAATTR